MERQPYSSDATAGVTQDSKDHVGLYEETCMDRICYFLCCRKKMSLGTSGSSLIHPPGLTESPKKPRMSDGTLFEVKSLSQDSVPAPPSARPDSRAALIQKECKRSYKTAEYSWPLKKRHSTRLTCESQPSTSTSAAQFETHRRMRAFSEQSAHAKSDGAESTNPNTGAVFGSDLTTVQSVRHLLANFWNRAKQLNFTVRRSQPSVTTSPPNEPPPVSTKAEGSSDIPKPVDSETVELTVGSSGSSFAVFRKHGQAASEGEYQLPGKDVSEQMLATSVPISIQSSSSEDKLDITTTQESISAEKSAGTVEYRPVSEKSTDAAISETASPSKTLPSEDEVNLISESTQPSTLESTSSEKIADEGGYSPLLAERTDAQVVEISISTATPTKSTSSGVDVDLTSKSIESLPTTQPSSRAERKIGEAGRSRFLSESTAAQVSDNWLSTPTKSISSGVGSISKSTKSLPISQQSTSARKTPSKGMYLPFLKSSASDHTSEFSMSTSIMSLSSEDELEFAPKSIESLVTTEQPGDEEKIEVVEEEKLEETEASQSQPVEHSNLEKSGQDKDEN